MARLALSLNERLMIHLLEMDRHKDDADVPVGASQEGMAQRFGTGVHNISRMLSSMVDDGLVSERLSHVRGAPKRRKVYFLTEGGLRAAQSLKADVVSRRVVLEHEGKAQEVSFEEAMKRIGSVTSAAPSVSEMIELASAGDAIRTDALPKLTVAGRCGPEFIERSHGRPIVGSFFGRETERKTLLEKLGARDTSSVLVWGMPGIGKSTLASKLFDELSGKQSMFWYSFREWDTDWSFLSALTEFLGAAGQGATSGLLRRGSSPAELFVPLAGDLGGCGAVMFLDDIQKCSRPVLSMISMVAEAARASQSSKTVLLSRTVPSFFSTTAQGNAAMELGGLDRDAAWHMAQSMSAIDTIKIVDESRGHPLLLSLMARGTPGQAKGDITSFIEREIYSAVSEEERRVLEILSVFRHPVHVDAVPDAQYSVIMGLKQKALVVEQEDGIWAHDLLRDFFSTHMSAQAKKQYHALAAAYCERNPEVEWKLESLYHLAEEGSWSGALRVVLSNAAELAAVFPEETLALVSRIPRGSGSNRENAELLFLRGQLYEELGKEESALADFEESLSHLEAEEDVEKRALVLEAQARLRSEVERWSEALSDHEKALRIYETANDREGQTREWMNIGGVLRRKGDLVKAREAYQRAIELATRHEDRHAEAACLNNLGLLDRDEGDFADAEAHLKGSARLAHTIGDPAGEARALENLAELLRAELRFVEMTDLLLESSEAFRRAGEIEEYKRLQAAYVEALSDQGKLMQGIETAEAALGDPDLRKRKGLFQRSPRFDRGDLALSETVINLYRSSKEAKKAQRELLRFRDIASSLGDREALARAELMRSMLQEDLGNLDASAVALDEAESILKSIGNTEGLIAVSIRRGALEERRGNGEAAASHYREAASKAERVGNEFAKALALEKLNRIAGRSEGRTRS